MRIDRLRLCAILALAVSLPAATAAAAPLEPEACATLNAEYGSLVAAGAKADMDRGPEWAKANLSPERLGKIERLIAVEEQLSFRCGEHLTARPAMKEPPAEAGDRASHKKGVRSSIPPPKRKDTAKAARMQATTQ